MERKKKERRKKERRQHDRRNVDQIRRQYKHTAMSKEEIRHKVYAWVVMEPAEIVGRGQLSQRQRIEKDYGIPPASEEIKQGIIPPIDGDQVLSDIVLLKNSSSIDIDGQIKKAKAIAGLAMAPIFDTRESQLIANLPQRVAWFGEVIEKAKQSLEDVGLRFSATDRKVKDSITNTKSTEYSTRKIRELWDFLEPRFKARGDEKPDTRIPGRLVKDIIKLLKPYFELDYEKTRQAVNRHLSS